MARKPGQHKTANRGFLLFSTIIFAAVIIVLSVGFTRWAAASLRFSGRVADKEQALQIAEAGIEYYRWHLAHDPNDFQDGTGGPGPYVHDYEDKDENVIGQFSLDITPPVTGSTVVTIRSTGTLVSDPEIARTIEARLAIPSLAKYAVVANNAMRFGEGTEVFGPIHSNGGIRFDGLAHNVVSSARDEYDDPDHSGGDEFGVHTHVAPTDPLPPASVPARPDVFEAGRSFPVPQVDFVGITVDLAQIKTDAQSSGHYFAASGAQGYHIVFDTDDTFDLYRVDSLVAPPSGCWSSQSNWGTWSVNQETLLATYANPGNGLIFVEDDVWVDGQIDTARLTVAAGKFPDTPSDRKSITVNNDLLYTNYNGQDVIGLIAQLNINAGMVSEDDLHVDAAMIAQNGRVGRFYYRPPYWIWQRCSPYHERDTYTSYGMIGTNQRYGFAYTDDTGYETRNLIYDANLLYGPPPNFPLTSETYETISWEEIE